VGIEMKASSMKIKNTIRPFLAIVCLALLLATSTFSQDYKGLYKTAKEYYAKEKYAEALDAFQGLTVYDKSNPFTEHASFYLALSAQKLGYALIAKETFIQITKLYPSWINIDEVKYQLACMYFKKGDYFLAVKELAAIKNAALVAEGVKAKQFYMAGVEDIETLKLLLEEFPTDSIVATRLTKLIADGGYEQEYQTLFESTVKKFELEISNYPEKEASQKERRVFTVSLLFPFMLSTLEPTPSKKKNQFVIDLYLGMKLAVDSLNKTGVQIELLAYDTERNLDTLKKILKSEELKATDLIVGPLFIEEAKLVNEFSAAHKIPVINPVSNNPEFLGNNKYAFLLKPSFRTIGQKTAEFSAKSRSKRTFAVFSGDSQKDSVMANGFIKTAKSLGMKMVLAETLTKEKAAQIQNILASATEFDKYKKPVEFKLKRNSIGCIFVATDNPLIFSKVVNSVEARNDSVLVIGSESWLKDNSVDYALYERLGVVFSASSFIASDSESYLIFRRKFIQTHGSFPSTHENYANDGYDFVMFLSEVLAANKSSFFASIKSTPFFPGVLSGGYRFKDANDNQHLSLLRFCEGQLQEVGY
jgi:tetratricopeptide (TPR) repeat protein